MENLIRASAESLTLVEISRYENPNLIYSFCSSFNVSIEQAHDIFNSMLKLLWLSQFKGLRLCLIDDPILIIDEMWHQFILYTNDYHKFCHLYFGKYIHHAPKTPLDAEKDRNRIREHIVEDKRKRYGMIYDLLGQETFIKWYYTYPTQYSKEQILKLRKK